MIQLTTVLNVADNSRARKLFCIQVMGGSRRKWGSIGNIIVTSVREALFSHSKVYPSEHRCSLWL